MKIKGILKVLTAILVPALLVGAGFYVLYSYKVETVYVEGNLHYTEEEIRDFVMNGALGYNSLYLSLKYKDTDITNIPFIDVMSVDILSPHTIRITVFEKTLAGYVTYMDNNIYFDKDGYVVETSNVKTKGVVQITGLNFDHVIMGDKLEVGDESVFKHILDITNLLKKYDLTADKIYFRPSGEITVYFGEVKVALGETDGNLEDKFMCLPGILPKLTGQKGTLQMQEYDEGGNYSFIISEN